MRSAIALVTYKSEQEDDSITHAREGDWIVSRVERFASFDTNMRIVVCYCKYDPIAPQWQKVNRGVSANELLDKVQAESF